MSRFHARRAMLLAAAMVLVGLLGLLLHRAQSARADDGSGGDDRFSLATLHGPYGAVFSGTLLINGVVPVPEAAVGQVVFDGQGSFTGSLVANAGGVSVPIPVLSGTYTVNPDGTGTICGAATDPATNTLAHRRLAFVIVDEGKEILAINAEDTTCEAEGLPNKPVDTVRLRRQ